jgi:hypothetical protein
MSAPAWTQRSAEHRQSLVEPLTQVGRNLGVGPVESGAQGQQRCFSLQRPAGMVCVGHRNRLRMCPERSRIAAMVLAIVALANNFPHRSGDFYPLRHWSVSIQQSNRTRGVIVSLGPHSKGRVLWQRRRNYIVRVGVCVCGRPRRRGCCGKHAEGSVRRAARLQFF